MSSSESDSRAGSDGYHDCPESSTGVYALGPSEDSEGGEGDGGVSNIGIGTTFDGRLG
jgi:hypothetical protein